MMDCAIVYEALQCMNPLQSLTGMAVSCTGRTIFPALKKTRVPGIRALGPRKRVWAQRLNAFARHGFVLLSVVRGLCMPR